MPVSKVQFRSKWLPFVISPYLRGHNKVLIIICFATFIATFDFTIFVFLADTLSELFFTQTDDLFSQKLRLVSLYAVGFIARPIGGYFFGKYGDKRGRRPALHLGLALLMITSIAAACLPTYSNVGVLASILLIAVRLVQGAAFANQLTLSSVYVAEDLPRKRLPVYISLICASSAFGGIFCAFFIAYLNFMYTPEQINAYAWRIPFVSSAIMGLVGYFLIRQLKETTLFRQQDRSNSLVSQNTKLFSSSIKINTIFMTALLTLIYSSAMIMFAILLPQLIDQQVSIETAKLRIINIVGLLFLSLGMLLYGWLANKFDVGRIFMLGAVWLCIQTILFYWYLGHGRGDLLILVYAILGFSNGFISLCPAIYVQMFPTRTRLTAINVIFNVITVFTGVLLPLCLFYIANFISFAPAFYLFFIAICTFFMGFYVYQTPQLNEMNHKVPH